MICLRACVPSQASKPWAEPMRCRLQATLWPTAHFSCSIPGKYQLAWKILSDYCVASEDYFRVLAIPLLRGRLFEERDVMDAPHVAVINNALAARWPNEDPLGKTIEFGNMDGDLRLLTIVGVVGDARNS